MKNEIEYELIFFNLHTQRGFKILEHKRLTWDKKHKQTTEQTGGQGNDSRDWMANVIFTLKSVYISSGHEIKLRL